MSTGQGTTASWRRRSGLLAAVAGIGWLAFLGLNAIQEPRRDPPAPLPFQITEAAPPAALAPPPEAGAETPAQLGTTATSSSQAFDCVIEPRRSVQIGSPVTGVIDAILVDRSDAVEAEQPLVQIEAEVERATVDLARAKAEMDMRIRAREARLDLLEKRKERASKLFDRDALAQDLRDEVFTEVRLARLELEEAREERALARLELETARKALQRRTIRSPISGVVTRLRMTEGEVVDEEVILSLAEIDPLRVEVVLPAEEFGRVRPGGRAEVLPELPPGASYVATVAVVDRVIDAASRTFGARLELPNPEHTIPSGLHCQVRFLEE